MTIITNDPVSKDSTNVSSLHQRTDTFVTTRLVFPELPLAGPRTFADEKATFLSMLPLLYSRYPGEYVAVARGAIVEHGHSKIDVVRRFFSRFTDTPVYVGFVGTRDVVRVPTPFIRRSR